MRAQGHVCHVRAKQGRTACATAHPDFAAIEPDRYAMCNVCNMETVLRGNQRAGMQVKCLDRTGMHTQQCTAVGHQASATTTSCNCAPAR